MPGDDFWDESDNIDYHDMKFSDLLSQENETIAYEYDFGDSWMHKLILEKIMAPDSGKKYPVCIAGKRNCPPEDCGGIWGYAGILEIIKNSGHEDHESVMEWLGGEFDPEYFNINEINSFLGKEDYGCFEFL